MAEDVPDNELVPIVMGCIQRLLEEDGELLAVGAHEQAVSGRLAGYLQQECRDLKVDTEYNRHGFRVKEASLQSGKKRVVPDVVIHSRGNDERNALAIELKLLGRGDEKDRLHAHEKLDALVHGDEFRYELGLYLELGTMDQVPIVASLLWYDRGRR